MQIPERLPNLHVHFFLCTLWILLFALVLMSWKWTMIVEHNISYSIMFYSIPFYSILFYCAQFWPGAPVPTSVCSAARTESAVGSLCAHTSPVGGKASQRHVSHHNLTRWQHFSHTSHSRGESWSSWWRVLACGVTRCNEFFLMNSLLFEILFDKDKKV